VSTKPELTPLERQLKLFERLATGRGKGEHARVVADNTPEHIDAEEKASGGMTTARQLMQARQVMFFYREAYRRVQAVTRAEAYRQSDDGSAHQWQPNRPHRRRATQ